MTTCMDHCKESTNTYIKNVLKILNCCSHQAKTKETIRTKCNLTKKETQQYLHDLKDAKLLEKSSHQHYKPTLKGLQRIYHLNIAYIRTKNQTNNNTRTQQ